MVINVLCRSCGELELRPYLSFARVKRHLFAALLSSTVALTTATASLAQERLPAPYVSRALDAVLIPVDDVVASAFNLGEPGGLLVLAVQPDGLADAVGLLPGDIIDAVDGRQFFDPIDLDKFVLFSLRNGITDFQFQGLSDGAAVAGLITITLEAWEEFIEVTTISTWESYSYETFSYSEYYEEYSEEITVSYEESITEIEETITSEEYSEEFESFESIEETEESSETTDESFDEEVVEEEVVDEEAAEDATLEEEDFCAANPDDPTCVGDEEDFSAEEESFEEESFDEEPVEEDYSDDAGDDGGEVFEE